MIGGGFHLRISGITIELLAYGAIFARRGARPWAWFGLDAGSDGDGRWRFFHWC